MRILGGKTQDRIATSILGRSVNPTDIISFSLKVNVNKEKIKEIVLLDKFRLNLNLDKRGEIDNGRIIIKSRKTGKYRTVMELKQGSDQNETIINEVFFQVGDYYVSAPDDSQWYAKFRIDGLKTILSGEYKIKVEDMPNSHAEALVNSVIHEMRGWSIHTEKLSRLGWVKVGAFVASLLITLLFMFRGDVREAVGTAAIILLYLAFELPSRLRRKGD